MGSQYIHEILINESKNGYIDYEKLNAWAGYIDEALIAIEPLQTMNSDIYNRLYKRIIAERLAVYFPAAYNNKNLGNRTVAEIREQFAADCEFLGVTSGGSLWPNLEDSLFNDWEKGSSGDSWWENLFPW